MSKILRSYLKFARGETKISPWMLFYPVQFLTCAWMKLRLGLYGRGIFSVTDPVLPVVSIGNNSLGGTNKTPMTELVVRQFLEAGIEAGLVSRGYRTKGHLPLWVGQDEESLQRETAGDEPLMLARRMPHVKIVVSKDRIKGVALLASLGAQVAVTDDTFQHRRMARDVDIVLVDSTCPFGNGNVIPAGLMREPMSSFSRADIIVLTKANQVSASEIAAIRNKIEPWADRDKIFTADIVLESWLVIDGEKRDIMPKDCCPHGRYIAFSAIGNTTGFYDFLKSRGVELAACRSYRDHHIFSDNDTSELESLAAELDADGFICTEKDTVNLSDNIIMSKPLYVPRIAVQLDDELRFRRLLHAKLKPRLFVASNGHGEDAIGVVLAKKMRKRFKSAEVSAFAFVGSGTHYKSEGFEVLSPSSVMPSGGVIKYSLWELMRDIRHGLGSAIRSQIRALRAISGHYRTPVCVGDVYLMANILWGQGLKPILLATAKTVHLNGHLSVEKWLLKKRSIFVWTRDAETAAELSEYGVNSGFDGNPIMDLIDTPRADESLWDGNGDNVLLLPGSRPRAYDDIRLVLDAARELYKRRHCEFVMVPALTIEIKKLTENVSGWRLEGERLIDDGGSLTIKIYHGEVAEAACQADLLIGLGGTANQLCAGLGVPVVSILETGKLRQKKLLREAEILVDADPVKLAEAAFRILTTPELAQEMREAGIRHLGGIGAVNKVVDYCGKVLGWDNRCFVYETYGRYLEIERASKNSAHMGDENDG